MLNLSVDEFDNFAYRMIKHLAKKEILTKNQFIQGFFILDDILKKRMEEKRIYNFENIKNILVKKYAAKIIFFRDEGLGSQRIEKALWENHRVKISRSTIQKFINLNKNLDHG